MLGILDEMPEYECRACHEDRWPTDLDDARETGGEWFNL